MLPDNLGYLFDAPLRLAPSSPALFQDDARITYAELDARCNRIATGLARLGVGAGDRVALMFSNLRDACVVPAPHGTKGEVPVAFVGERERGGTTEDDVKRFCLAHGAPYAHPRRVVFVEALPLGGTGKLDRTALKAKARELGIPA
jgi:acyl-CoA synthetase (AMP-forming)/AMP-acid ligase II